MIVLLMVNVKGIIVFQPLFLRSHQNQFYRTLPLFILYLDRCVPSLFEHLIKSAELVNSLLFLDIYIFMRADRQCLFSGYKAPNKEHPPQL